MQNLRAALSQCATMRFTNGSGGEVSFRKSTAVATLAGVTQERAIELCHKAGKKDFIRLAESLDKEFILGQKLTETGLAVVGLRHQVKDEFGYKTDREKIIAVLESNVSNLQAHSA